MSKQIEIPQGQTKEELQIRKKFIILHNSIRKRLTTLYIQEIVISRFEKSLQI